MQEEQSTTKADTTAQPHPDAGPYDPDTNPDGYLPIPLWVCRCDHYEPDPPWYRRLTDRVAGWFSRC